MSTQLETIGNSQSACNYIIGYGRVGSGIEKKLYGFYSVLLRCDVKSRLSILATIMIVKVCAM